jgi:hypothetical protein
MNDKTELLAKIAATDGIPDPQRQQLEKLVREMPEALRTDVWVYRMVVFFLGSAVLSTILGGLYIATTAADLPEGLIALGSAAVGALAGLLAPAPSHS